MQKYIRAVFVGGDYEDPSMTADEIIMEDDEPEFTGLFDPAGQKIYRDRDRVTFGFVGKTTCKS